MVVIICSRFVSERLLVVCDKHETDTHTHTRSLHRKAHKNASKIIWNLDFVYEPFHHANIFKILNRGSYVRTYTLIFYVCNAYFVWKQ